MCSKTVVITGGPIFPEAAKLISSEDRIICADSGVDYALSNNIRVDEVFGDLDSISASGKEYIKVKDIPLNQYPCE